MSDNQPKDQNHGEAENKEVESGVIDVSFTEEPESPSEGPAISKLETEADSLVSPEEDVHYYHETIKSKKRRKDRSFAKFFVGTLILSLVGGTAIGAGFAVTNELLKASDIEESVLERTYTPATVTPLSANASIAEIASHVGPSVVSIKNNKVVNT